MRAGFSHDVRISAQGLDKRFTEKAAEFVKRMLEEALGQVIKASAAVDVEILQWFSHVYVADGSLITLPDELHEYWQGTGGAVGSSRSALKLDTCIELNTGQLQCNLQHGKQSDNRSPLANAVYERGSLRLQDLGYFNLERMKAQSERGEYWISRYQINTTLFDEQGLTIDLPSTLHGLKLAGVRQRECCVELGVKIHLKARLLLMALPEEAAARCRAKMKEIAVNNGRTATQATKPCAIGKYLSPMLNLSYSVLKTVYYCTAFVGRLNYCSNSGKVIANWDILTVPIRGADCASCTRNCSSSSFSIGFS